MNHVTIEQSFKFNVTGSREHLLVALTFVEGDDVMLVTREVTRTLDGVERSYDSCEHGFIIAAKKDFIFVCANSDDLFTRVLRETSRDALISNIVNDVRVAYAYMDLN